MSDSVERSDALSAREAEAGGPTAMVASLKSGLDRVRRIQRLTVIGLVLDVMLSIGVGLVFGVALHNQNASHLSCLAGNEFRVKDRALWAVVLQSGVTVKDPAKVSANLDRTFAPRVCK